MYEAPHIRSTRPLSTVATLAQVLAMIYTSVYFSFTEMQQSSVIVHVLGRGGLFDPCPTVEVK